MAELIEVKSFLHRHNAELARELLISNQIESVVSGDDCGGYRPHLVFGETFKLLVREDDADKAREILKTFDRQEDDGDN